MQQNEWLIIEKVVALLEIFQRLTKTMSHKYANASLIIPQVMALKATLAIPEIKNMLVGIQQTVKKLQEQMKTRYQPYLDNPDLMVSTYVDPRWKGVPFKNETVGSKMSLIAVEELVIERYFKHQKEQKMYEEQKRKEKEEEEAKNRKEQGTTVTVTVNKPPAASTPNDIVNVMVDEVSDNTAQAISLCSLFDKATAQLFGGEDDEDKIEEAEEVMSPDEQHKRIVLAHELKTYKELKRIGTDDDPLEWWHMNARGFPNLKTVAAIYLSSPPSSVESERTFSIGGNIVTKDRTRLTAENTEKLIFLNSNLPLLPVQDYSKYC